MFMQKHLAVTSRETSVVSGRGYNHEMSRIHEMS